MYDSYSYFVTPLKRRCGRTLNSGSEDQINAQNLQNLVLHFYIITNHKAHESQLRTFIGAPIFFRVLIIGNHMFFVCKTTKMIKNINSQEKLIKYIFERTELA